MVYKNGELLVETDSDGVFKSHVQKATSHKLKLRVSKDDKTLTYDLNPNASEEVFPFQLGDGQYDITLFENVQGKMYAMSGSVSIPVKNKDQNAPFLHPNQYVNYSDNSAVVTKAAEICDGKDEEESYNAICKFVVSNFAYDFIKAVTVKPGMRPDIDGTFKKRMGICQDLAAVTVAMLRSRGIPSKLVIGYADKQYHAWVQSVVCDKEVMFDPTQELHAMNRVKNYVVERVY